MATLCEPLSYSNEMSYFWNPVCKSCVLAPCHCDWAPCLILLRCCSLKCLARAGKPLVGLSKDSHVRMALKKPWWWVCIPTHDMTLSTENLPAKWKTAFLIVGMSFKKAYLYLEWEHVPLLAIYPGFAFWNNIAYSRCPLKYFKVFFCFRWRGEHAYNLIHSKQLELLMKQQLEIMCKISLCINGSLPRPSTEGSSCV